MIGIKLEEANLGRYRPISCERCGSVGTIVEMGLCCTVHRWAALGGIWDITANWRNDRRGARARPTTRRSCL